MIGLGLAGEPKATNPNNQTDELHGGDEPSGSGGLNVITNISYIFNKVFCCYSSAGNLENVQT